MLWPLLRSPHIGPVEKLASLVELTMPATVSLCIAYFLLTLVVCIRLPILLSYRGYEYLALLGSLHAIATLALMIQLTSPFLLSFHPWRFAWCLFYFPYYACWKLAIALRPRPRTWVPTARETLPPGP